MRDHLASGCLAFGILCFLYYCIITVYAGFRTSISWIWLLCGSMLLLLWKAEKYLSLHPASKLRWFTAAVSVLIVSGLIVMIIAGSRIIGAMAAKPVRDLEYVVVLGAQVKGKRPSRALRLRLDGAAEYLQENPDTILVLSGGQGSGEEITEARCMYEYLIQQGADPAHLLLEEASTSTEENLVFSDELYHLKKRRVGVISNNFHIYRALCLAKSCGYKQVFSVPAPSTWIMQPHNILREICCLLLEKIQGKIP